MAAFGVGLIAFTGGAAAQVPDCTPKASTGNDSCVKLNVTPSDAPATFTGGQRLFVRAKTAYTNTGNCDAGGCVARATLDFDNDFAVNPGTIPTCGAAKAYGSNQDIAAVWDDCGPHAGASANAYLSTQIAPTDFGCTANPCVSGQTSVWSSAFNVFVNGCILVFNGPIVNGNPTLTVYGRAPISQSACATNPANNHSGSQTRIVRGLITNSPVAGYGKRITLVPVIPNVPAPVGDVYAYLKRANYFQARCPAGTSPWKLRGAFVYSGSGEANDVIAPPYPGTTQACS
jgi:hypothetical protein